LEEKVAAPVYKAENTTVGILHADHVVVYPQKLASTSPTSGSGSLDIVRSLTHATEFSFSLHMLTLRSLPSNGTTSENSNLHYTRSVCVCVCMSVSYESQNKHRLFP
jgi:hypothetical protein